jgi:hypothetical protein
VQDSARCSEFNRAWVRVCELEEQARECGLSQDYDAYLEAEVALRVQVVRWEVDDPCFTRLTALLDRFYSKCPRPPTSARLLVKRFKSPGTYRIAPGFSLVTEELPEPLKASLLAKGREEMLAFTAFLRERYEASSASKAT